MIHDTNIIAHNWLRYTDYYGNIRYSIIMDIMPHEPDVRKIYGDRHLFIFKKNIDIPENKTACRIPITVQLPDAPFTEFKLTRIKRKYLVDGGSGKFATLNTLIKYFDALQLATINDAIAEAVQKYVEQLPEIEVV